MSGINKCEELGCAACCGEITFNPRFPIPDATFKLLVGDSRVLGVDVQSFTAEAILAPREKGKNDVVAAPLENPEDRTLWWLVHLVGKCPQLGQDEGCQNGVCQIYENRPVPCRAFPDPYGNTIGGPACDEIRVARGMRPFNRG